MQKNSPSNKLGTVFLLKLNRGILSEAFCNLLIQARPNASVPRKG